MAMEKRLTLPLDEAAVRQVAAGDLVLLSGPVFTARDAVHHYLAGGGACPCDLRNAVIYHCGPVVVREGSGWRVTAAGPTTSQREEPYMATLIERFGIRGVIGKGGMGEATRQACRRCGCLYLHAVGGAAQVLADTIREVRAVHFLERFGAPEAMWELLVEDFPAVVTMDAAGQSLHEDVLKRSRAAAAALLATTRP
jgi:tartrate/fumarate subfamily iron-sulfur-dependent hydro-lyase beta chain